MLPQPDRPSAPWRRSVYRPPAAIVAAHALLTFEFDQMCKYALAGKPLEGRMQAWINSATGGRRRSPAPACSAARTCSSRSARCLMYWWISAAGSSISGPCAGSARAGLSLSRRSSEPRYSATLPPCEAGITTVVPCTSMSPDKQRSRFRVPEANMIGSVPGRVDDLQGPLTGLDQVAVGQRRPGEIAIADRPRHLRHQGRRPSLPNRRGTRNVIAMRVRHHEMKLAIAGRRVDGIEVRRRPDTRVDQHWTRALNQVGPVAVTGERTRIAGVQRNRLHFDLSPTNETTTAKNIRAAELKYGVVMPYASYK